MDTKGYIPYTRATRYGWTGRVKVLQQNGRVLWSEKAGPVRLTREDAREDADRLARDRALTIQD